jgi:pyrimidine 5'-nucleotidase
MFYTSLFFDLDDTLYPSSSGLWNAIRDRMSTYMHEHLGLPWDQIPCLRHQYMETYGTTLRGLQHHYQIDADEYLAYVHDLPLENYLHPEPRLRVLLGSLPQRKWIFTNADANHAERVLAVLELAGCFDGYIDVRAQNFLCKPAKETYFKALEIAEQPEPSRCVMLDDSTRNLLPAFELGFKTVKVGPTENFPHISYSISSLLDLPDSFPNLWL